MKHLNNCKILIVEDTKTNIDILVRALCDDYKLAVVQDGPKAITCARSTPLDLILLDVMMPKMTGFEVCRKLKADPATCNIPIIFITAMDSADDKARGFTIGAVDYITKPFDITEVKARVKTHLSLKIAQEALENQNGILEKLIKERTQKLLDTQLEIIERLGLAAEHRDNETGQHIKRMSEYCRILGRTAGLAAKEYDNLALASTMHDVGKIGIPDSILLKKGKLTDDEWRIIKTHPDIGAQLLSGSSSRLLQEAEIITRTHHEKWDGSGYPCGLKAEEIPLAGRIACICDVFDALVSERPYKKPWPVDKAMAEIQAGSGKHFDPKLVKLFVALQPELVKVIQKFGDS